MHSNLIFEIIGGKIFSHLSGTVMTEILVSTPHVMMTSEEKADGNCSGLP